MKIYLAAPHADDSFRTEVTRRLSRLQRLEVVDPMVARDFRGKEIMNEDAIVRGDLADIVSCDLILGNYSIPGWGTGMETWFGYSIGRPVVAYVDPQERVSPWVAHVAGGYDRVFRDTIVACNYILAIS